MAADPKEDISLYLIPPDTPVNKLDCTEAFKGLTDKEKLYAHHFGRACWEGGLICLLQTSPESPGIFLLLGELFRGQSLEALKELANGCGLSDDEYKSFLAYSAAFYSNFGNYKSFGDTKFIPDLPREKLEKVITSSQCYRDNKERISFLWSSVADGMFSLHPPAVRQLAFPPDGITTYYSGNCVKEDAEIIKEFMLSKDLSPYNTRLFKNEDGTYEIRLASSLTNDTPPSPNDKVSSLLGLHQFPSTRTSSTVSIKISRGDYHTLMKRMTDELEAAAHHVANSNQKDMIDRYVSSFSRGSVPDHEDASRYWIKDKGPVVETYIGFIESYRDPFGLRGEYEGFVAVVNKSMSSKFSQLVDSAQEFLPLLPWGVEFEKDKFLRPDFTSLDVVSFASSGIPAGINIPNYDEIRQNEGFKNVSLGNVLSAASQDKRITFLTTEDQGIFTDLRGKAFEVQVGLHELLGHGSGKLFSKDKNGVFNFEQDKVINPLTGDKIASWYNPGETWDTQFSTIASTYEECRAECVGIYLSTDRNILRIFGYEGAEAEDIMYVNWLSMLRAGLIALEFYTPETKKWRQAHMQARYVILRVLMDSDTPVFNIESVTGSDGKPDLLIRFDRNKLETIAKPVIGEFLNKLQIYKSTADVSSGQLLYNKYSTVTDDHLMLRDIVMARKMPRRLFVQPHTSIDTDGSVVLNEFDSSFEGIISSFLARYPNYDTELESLWRNDQHYWKQK